MSLRQFWNAYVAYTARMREAGIKTLALQLFGELAVLLILTAVITLFIGAVSGNGWSTSTAKIVALTLVAIEFVVNTMALRSRKRA